MCHVHFDLLLLLKAHRSEASNRAERQEETQFRVMRLLTENPEISTRQIADAVGVSNGKAYYCVSALIEKGLVKVKNFSNSEQKTSYLYQLTPRGIREKALLSTKFLERKLKEFEDLQAEIARLEEDLGEIHERQNG
jgi:EPS-associated MarR family transcriptional regulator